MQNSTGKYIIIAGLILVIIGLLISLWGDKLHFLGKLPGDIRIEKENIKVYIPITSMLLISIFISIIITIIKRVF